MEKYWEKGIGGWGGSTSSGSLIYYTPLQPYALIYNFNPLMLGDTPDSSGPMTVWKHLWKWSLIHKIYEGELWVWFWITSLLQFLSERIWSIKFWALEDRHECVKLVTGSLGMVAASSLDMQHPYPPPPLLLLLNVALYLNGRELFHMTPWAFNPETLVSTDKWG